MTAPVTDPFANAEKNPSVSFKDAPVGTSYTGRVTETPQLVQGRNYETGDPDTWPDGNPKMVAVVTIDIGGELRSLWAPKPSALFAAIGKAQRDAGEQIAPGGSLTVTFTGEVPNAKNPRLNPQKQYAVTYRPADAFTTDALTGEVAGPGGQAPATASGGTTVPPNAATAPSAGAPAGGPTPEQIAAVKAAGLDPSVVFPGHGGGDEPPF